MITIKTKSGDILCVEVPEECLRIQNIDFPDWYLYDAFMDNKRCDLIILYGKSGTLQKEIELPYNIKDLKIIGKLSELIDEDCEEFVDLTPTGLFILYNWSKEKVDELGIQPITYSPKKSFISLLQSEDVDTSKEWLIIKVI